MTTQTELRELFRPIASGVPESIEQFQFALDAAYLTGQKVAAAQPEQPAPQGWKLVPVEPTPEMLQTGWKAHPSAWGDEILPPVWAAMLAASPTPPQAEHQGCDKSKCSSRSACDIVGCHGACTAAPQAEAVKPVPLAQQIRESVLLSPVNPPMLRIHGVNAEVLERAAKRWHAADEAANPENVCINGLTEAETSATASVMVLVKPEMERAELLKVIDAFEKANKANYLESFEFDQWFGKLRKAAALLSADSKDAGEPETEQAELLSKIEAAHADALVKYGNQNILTKDLFDVLTFVRAGLISADSKDAAMPETERAASPQAFTTPDVTLNALLEATYDMGTGDSNMDCGLYWFECLEKVLAKLSADSKDAGEPVAENDEEHPNNRLLFNRMCLHFGISPGEDSVSQALAKISRPQAADAQPLTVPFDVEFAADYLDGVMEDEHPEIQGKWAKVRVFISGITGKGNAS